MRLIDFINAGGSITWILVGMNILGSSLILWRVFAFRDFKKNMDQYTKEVAANLRSKFPGKELLNHLELVKDGVFQRVHGLEFGMNTIKVIATTAPLLGLLGTVMGIYEAFQVISQKGLSDPGQFASGISFALITTIVGLIVAIPHYVAHNYLTGQLDAFEIEMEQKIAPELKA